MNRHEDLIRCLDSLEKVKDLLSEIIVVDNNSDVDSKLILESYASNMENIRVFSLLENLGVAGGRNFGFNKATSDIVFSLDDDAILLDRSTIIDALDEFNKNPNLGAVGTKSYLREIGSIEWPAVPSAFAKRFYSRGFKRVGRFIGVANFIRRDFFIDVGGYGDFFPYGHEEIDLSLKFFKKGYDIFFDARNAVLHMKVEKARLFRDRREFLSNQLEKKWRIAYYHLPLVFRFIAISLRSLQYVVFRGRFDFWILSNTYKKFTKSKRNELKDRMSFSKAIKGVVQGAPVLW
jgi:GT2 family glycosyltransferase